jgi:perosamine synthetase
MIPYAKHSFSNREIKACSEILKNGYLTMGQNVSKFEDAFMTFSGAPYAACVSSGTAALHLACIAAGFGEGDEVIVPSITFIATANCVLYTGATPVFADIDPETGNMRAEDILKCLTPRTRGVIIVHYAGQPVDLRAISAVTKRKKLILIEDAAHALGAEYQGSTIGDCRYSDFCAFSFHPAKNITTGEGGMVTTRRFESDRVIRDLRNHGMVRDPNRWKSPEKKRIPYYEMQDLGFNYRLTDFQCAIGIEQLKRLPSFIARRRQIAELYEKLLKDVPEVRLLKQKKGLSARHIFVIRLRVNITCSRDRMIELLNQAGIGATIHYLPVPSHPFYQSLVTAKPVPPASNTFGEEIITLPLYYGLSNKKIKSIVATIKQILLKYRKTTKPVWAGNKVLLRPIAVSDLNSVYLSWLNDSHINRYLLRKKQDIETMVDYYEERLRKKKSDLFLAACDKRSGRHFGNVTLSRIKNNTAIFGIMIGDKNYLHKGWGLEVIGDVCKFSRSQLGLKKIILGVLPKNRRAIRAFQRAGFKICGSKGVEGTAKNKIYKMEKHLND